MYESLENVCDEFELYVLAMSDKCYEILVDLNYPHIKPIRLVDFEDEELLKVKPTRKVGEYCWTCSSSLIRYVLMTYNPEYCTYIDADLFFYSDPKVVIDEMVEKHASVQVVGHRFNKYEKKKREWKVGKYCVEFNTFKNDQNGLKLLELWRNQCLEHCSIDGDGVYWGDQKYLDHWCDDYSFCMETLNLGVGVGPWNIAQYKYVKGTSDTGLQVKCKKSVCQMCFYHFENIQYLQKKKMCINVFCQWGVDKKLVDELYIPYLGLVDKKKNLLKEKYGLEFLIRHHPGVVEKKEQWMRKIFKKRRLDDLKTFFYVSIPSKLFKKNDMIEI